MRKSIFVQHGIRAHKKSRVQKPVIMLILIALVINLCSCSLLDGQGESSAGQENTGTSKSSGSSGQSGSFAQDEVDRGIAVDEFKVAILIPDSLLPWEVTDQETARLLMLVEEPLFNVTETRELSYCLAQSAKMGPDGSFADIQLKDDIVFHNQAKLTNQDVIYTIEKLMETQNAFSAAVDGIDKVKALSNNTVRIYFKEKGLLNLEDLVFPIVPKDYKEALVPMGTGPYKFDSLEAEREMMFKRDPSYRGQVPGIEWVRVFFVRDEEAIFQCFETNRTNLYFPEDLEWGRYLNRTDRKIHESLSEEAVYLLFQEDGSFASSLSNRQKLVMALDAEKLLKIGYWGRGVVSSLPLSPYAWYTEGLEETYSYDLDRANHMETVGYHTVLIGIDQEDPVLSRVMSEITAELEEAGLSVRFVSPEDPCDAVLCRGRLDVKTSALLLGMEDHPELSASKEKIRKAASAMNDLIRQEVMLFPLFYLYEGTVTGYGIEGDLTPGVNHPYCGIEMLYQKEGS